MKQLSVNFIASVKDDRIGDVRSIAQSLIELGCEITNVLAFSGIITGRANSGISSKLLKIDGIKDIELDRSVKVVSK
ncbi:MAG: hypothetical protein QM534_07125 [Sediminibacterium sp.]|nr:hypothetical protein [Sediminibacterium sp.]